MPGDEGYPEVAIRIGDRVMSLHAGGHPTTAADVATVDLASLRKAMTDEVVSASPGCETRSKTKD